MSKEPFTQDVFLFSKTSRQSEVGVFHNLRYKTEIHPWCRGLALSIQLIGLLLVNILKCHAVSFFAIFVDRQ